MITVSNTTAQTLTPGQSITFNSVVWKSGRSESFRNLSSAIRVGTGVYDVSFSGNMTNTVAATPVQLQIALDGAALPETIMIVTPTTAGDFFNASTRTTFGNCPPQCGSLSVTVTNTGTSTLTIGAGANLTVSRRG